jgi:hypothetical protein
MIMYYVYGKQKLNPESADLQADLGLFLLLNILQLLLSTTIIISEIRVPVKNTGFSEIKFMQMHFNKKKLAYNLH